MPRLGDVANVLVLTNTVVYLGAVLAHEFGFANFFSPSFLKDGFCVASKDQPIFQSHALCFYVDTVCTLLLWYLSRRYAEMKGADRVSNAAAGVFIHGLLHLATWRHTTTSLTEPANELPGIKLSMPIADRLGGVSLNYAFFFLLYRSAPAVPNWHGAVHAVWGALLLSFWVPPRFGFSFVNAILLWVVAGYDLLSSGQTKDRFYNLNALMITLPVGLVAWLESSACESFFKAIGGAPPSTIPTSCSPPPPVSTPPQACHLPPRPLLVSPYRYLPLHRYAALHDSHPGISPPRFAAFPHAFSGVGIL